MRLGIADHLGWAVAVTASADHEVVDRRRIELIEPGMSPAPIHYESRRLDVAATAALVADVAGVRRSSGVSCTRRDRHRAARADPLDLAATLAARLPRRHRRPTSRAVRGPGRRHHVPPGARRARTRSWLGSPPLRREGSGRSGGPACWPSGPTRSCTGPGQRWGHPGRRTIGSRSPRRSSPVAILCLD